MTDPELISTVAQVGGGGIAGLLTLLVGRVVAQLRKYVDDQTAYRQMMQHKLDELIFAVRVMAGLPPGVPYPPIHRDHTPVTSIRDRDALMRGEVANSGETRG